MLRQLSITTALLFGVVFLTDTAIAAEPATGQWDVAIVLTSGDRANGVDADGDLSAAQDEISAAMPPLGVKVSIADHKLALSGAEGVEQLRGVLFDDASGLINVLGGPVALTLSVAGEPQPLRLELEARPTTGYQWEVRSSDKASVVQPEESSFTMRYPGMGAPAVQTIDLLPRAAGTGVVQLIYRRPFEPDAPIRARIQLQVGKVGANGVIELTDPTPTELKSDDDSQSGRTTNPPVQLPERRLDASYDARPLGIIPAVRDQGGCGSCWAFGTVSVMETAIKKGGGPLTDLSEQFLVSCNKDRWSCDGGLTASKYHFNTLAYSQSVAGAVLEADKPYTATDGTCTSALSHPYKASAWQFLTGSEWTMPTTDQIKNAIVTYGAVTAGVCADNGWRSYTGGVYSPTSNSCGGSTNHQIALVGWNDATQSWILRNSWGTSWGEAGYMRIKYDPSGVASRVGEGTSWINYEGGAVSQPDFIVTGMTLNPGTPTAAGTFSATVTVKNQGTASGSGGSLGLWVNQSTSQDCGAGSDQSKTVGTLAAGASANFTFAALSAGTAGTKTLRGFVDRGCGTTESNDANNQFTLNYTVVPASLPDVTITGITLSPASPAVGGTFSATVTVKNQGSIAGAGGSLGVWTNQGANQDCGVASDQAKTVGTLAAGASASFTFTGLSSGAAGAKILRGFVDRACGTTESNENNNQSTVNYTVTAAALPDLAITGIILTPSSPTAGGTFSAKVTVKNQGTASGAAGSLDVWTDQSTTQSCGAVGNQSKPMGTLAAGASASVTFTGLSAGVSGAKTFLGFVDRGCGTAEPNKTNNQVMLNYTVATRGLPDFAITGIILSPVSPTTSGTFTAKVTVKNKGAAAGSAGWLDVWTNQPANQNCGADGNQMKSVGTIAAGASVNITFTGLRARMGGSNTFRAIVDSYCQVTESDEADNQYTNSYTVGGVPGAGFNEQFIGGTAGNWIRDSGTWSVVSNQYYYTAGTPNLRSVSTYNMQYTDLDYSARILRENGDGSANALYIRASGEVLSDGGLANYYGFQVTRNGAFSVWKRVSGISSALQDWTGSNAIIQGASWNLLRVVAKGSALAFYINNIPVWEGTDTSLTSGRTAVTMYRDSATSTDGFRVDWATLSPNPVLTAHRSARFIPTGPSIPGDENGIVK